MAFEYLKYRAKFIAVIAVIAGVFSASYLLFDAPVIVVLYPLGLILGIIAVVGTIDFARFARIHQLLTMAAGLPHAAKKTEEQDHLPATSDAGRIHAEPAAFPAPGNLIEQDYQAIIHTLQEEMRFAHQKACIDYKNMMDYYTVWAHQIKTPIAAMHLKLQSEDTDFSRKLIGDLKRIEAYVEMVLTFLRLDSDSTDYVIREHQLDEILRPAIRKFSTDFIIKKLTLDFQPTNYMVLTDEKWFSFIIEQLISNAVKYTAAGAVRVYMNEPGILCVEDTGIGISAEDLPRIFENGYTGFNGREDKRASGIGLYLCKRIADNLGHPISARSEIGAGTTIMLDLRSQRLGVE